MTSKRSPARCLSKPSAICERAELWVHRNSTRPRAPASAAAGTLTPLHRAEHEVSHRIAEQGIRGLAIEGVEAPLSPLLLPHQPGVLELAHVVGDLGLPHPEEVLELADADARVLIARRDTEVCEVAAAPPCGHHPEHPHPDGIREGVPQGDKA